MRLHRSAALALFALQSWVAAGGITYNLEVAANPTADQTDAYAKIRKAMDSAVGYYDTYTSIRKSLNIQYNPDVATADGGSGGTIRFGSSRSYMVVITAMHEISHTVGVGTTSQYQAYVSNGFFTGPLATAALREVEGNDTVRLHCDAQHIWPYGLNYASEVKSTQDLVKHAKIVGALYQDLFHESTYFEGRIRNVGTKTCIARSGNALVLGSCTDTASFVRIVAMGEAAKVYRLELGDRVLDISNKSTVAGIAAGTYDWNGGTNQEFTIEPTPLSSVQSSFLKMVHSGLHLRSEGTTVVQDASTATITNRAWELIRGSVPNASIDRRESTPPSGRKRDRFDALGRRGAVVRAVFDPARFQR